MPAAGPLSTATEGRGPGPPWRVIGGADEEEKEKDHSHKHLWSLGSVPSPWWTFQGYYSMLLKAFCLFNR